MFVIAVLKCSVPACNCKITFDDNGGDRDCGGDDGSGGGDGADGDHDGGGGGDSC